MTAYSDLPQVNALYEEQDKITRAMAILDNGGTVGMFTCVPPPFVPPPQGEIPATYTPPVQVTTVAPSPALITEVRNAMLARYDAITSELSALGVSGAPAGL